MGRPGIRVGLLNLVLLVAFVLCLGIIFEVWCLLLTANGNLEERRTTILESKDINPFEASNFLVHLLSNSELRWAETRPAKH